MEPYINYVRALAARGYTTQAIQNDLLSRGIDTQTVAWLVQAAAAGGPPPGATTAEQSAPNTALPSFRDTLPQLAKPESAVAQQPAGPGLVQRATTPSPSAVVDNDASMESMGNMKGYFATLLLCLIPAVYIAFDAPFAQRFGTSTRTLLTFGDIAGVIGLVLYAVNLVLSMRLPALEDWFGGLNRAYIAHAILGGLALVFIMIHPVLIALRYIPLGWHTVGGFFLPSMQYIPSAYGIFALALMLVLLIITLYTHLPYRLWLWTHKLLGLAYFLIALHVLWEPNVITDSLFVRWYLILVVLAGAAAYTYRTLLPNILVKHYTYVIKSVQQKATGVQEITMTPTNQAMPFKAGQFIFMAFDADGLSPEWHPFTIVSPPGDGSVSVAVKSLGAYTETITRLLPNMTGMSVRIEGAYGRFSFRNFHNANQVWIAGGIGITPFLSMAQALGDGPYNIDLYYSVRSEAELMDIDVLARQQSNKPDQVFRVIPFVTEKYNRRLSADMIAATSGDLHGRDFLLCGPAPMMNSMKEQLLKAGVKKYRIHSEEFSIT